MQHQPKNYIGLADDHSSSMSTLRVAAIRDSNANIDAIRNASSREVVDTIVSRNDFADGVTRVIINSNPHVLQPTKDWPTGGMTALYDAIYDLIQQFEAVPDYSRDSVSFLIMATTDGGENASNTSSATLRRKIEELQKTGRWTFVLRVPKGQRENYKIKSLGIPAGNIQEWDTTTAGMEKSTAQTTVAMDNFIAQKAKGIRGSSSFYVDAQQINLAQLDDVSSQYKLYTVPDVDADDGMMISAFILRHRMQYLKGAAFYQLVKTESKVGPDKQILIQERTTGKVYAGDQARKMLNLPIGQNARITPTDLAGYNIFIQSTSWNRKLPKGTGVLYNDKLGVPFTQEEIERFTVPAAPKVVPQAPAAAMLPQPKGVVGRNIKSSMPTTQAQQVFYATRDDARRDKAHGAEYMDLGSDKPRGARFLQTKRPSR